MFPVIRLVFCFVIFSSALKMMGCQKLLNMEFYKYSYVARKDRKCSVICNIQIEFKLSSARNSSNFVATKSSTIQLDSKSEQHHIDEKLTLEFGSYDEEFTVIVNIYASIKQDGVYDSMITKFKVKNSKVTDYDIKVQNSAKSKTVLYEYSVTCKYPEYIMPDCLAKNCTPKDDASGHYICSATGDKICLPGWTGETTNCSSQISTKAISSSSFVSVVPLPTYFSSILETSSSPVISSSTRSLHSSYTLSKVLLSISVSLVQPNLTASINLSTPAGTINQESTSINQNHLISAAKSLHTHMTAVVVFPSLSSWSSSSVVASQPTVIPKAETFNNDYNLKLILIIVASAAAFLVLILLCRLCYQRKRMARINATSRAI